MAGNGKVRNGRDPLKFGIFIPSVSHNPNISRYKPEPEDWTFESNKRIVRTTPAQPTRNYPALRPNLRPISC